VSAQGKVAGLIGGAPVTRFGIYSATGREATGNLSPGGQGTSSPACLQVPPTSVPPAPSGFEDVVAEFLADTLDASPDEPLAVPAMDDWPAANARLVARAGPRYWQRRRDREARVAAELAAIAPRVTVESLTAFAAASFSVAAPPDFTALGDVDLGYVKINHGLWEHIYWMFAPPDPERMRVTESARFRDRYVESGFLDFLVTAIGRVARPEGERLRFQGLHFGVSLDNGTHPHGDVLAGFAGRPPRQQLVMIGAAIGMAAWWQTLAPGCRPDFCDGSFPKQGLATGGLRTTLAWAAARSERVLFVVPPHLAGIRLADVAIPQETLIVPPKTIHESWAPCLDATARHVLGRLAADGRLLVITQSAVFSAALGMFLLDARRRLLPADARLRFFDLGQALDVAAPADGGLWAKQHARGDLGLFFLSEA
jgi:hypothetical protein